MSYDDGVLWDAGEPDTPPKEEPDCGDCSDRGHVRRRLLPGWRRCPGCNPGWATVTANTLRVWWWRVRPRRGVGGPPPF